MPPAGSSPSFSRAPPQLAITSSSVSAGSAASSARLDAPGAPRLGLASMRPRGSRLLSAETRRRRGCARPVRRDVVRARRRPPAPRVARGTRRRARARPSRQRRAPRSRARARCCGSSGVGRRRGQVLQEPQRAAATTGGTTPRRQGESMYASARASAGRNCARSMARNAHTTCGDLAAPSRASVSLHVAHVKTDCAQRASDVAQGQRGTHAGARARAASTSAAALARGRLRQVRARGPRRPATTSTCGRSRRAARPARRGASASSSDDAPRRVPARARIQSDDDARAAPACAAEHAQEGGLVGVRRRRGRGQVRHAVRVEQPRRLAPLAVRPALKASASSRAARPPSERPRGSFGGNSCSRSPDNVI